VNVCYFRFAISLHMASNHPGVSTSGAFFNP
jgi:hypothetical protein